MESKLLIWLGTIIGSTVGSFIPSLWGAGVFSFSSIILGTAGAIGVLWLGFKISQEL